MSAPNEPDFDWTQAASLLGDDPNEVADDMAAIVQELVEGSDIQFEELKAKNAETERKAIASQAHQLRGCLLNFGFSEVGAILMQIEKGDYTQNEYPILVDNARRVFAISKKMLATRYPSIRLS